MRGRAAAFVALVAVAACGGEAQGAPATAEVPAGIVDEIGRSTDCRSLRHEADVMQGRIDRGADGAIDRAVLEAATARMAELRCT